MTPGDPRPRLPDDFWRYLAAVALSNLGDGIRFGALPLLTASITRDPIAVSAVSGITMLPVRSPEACWRRRSPWSATAWRSSISSPS